MSQHRNGSSPSRPRPVPHSSSQASPRARSPTTNSFSRAAFTARLASSPAGSNPTIPTSNAPKSESYTPLAGVGGPNSSPGPGQSALATALQGSLGNSVPRFGTPPTRPLSPLNPESRFLSSEQPSKHGSFDARSAQGAHGWASPPIENPEIVKRHLVRSSDIDGSDEGARSANASHQPSNANLRRERQINSATGLDEDDFSSLQLQGGDMTRGVYKWAEDAESGSGRKRTQSFHLARPQPESGDLDIGSIKVPGGFRRNYLQRQARSPVPPPKGRQYGSTLVRQPAERSPPQLFTRSFIEFLTLYGHFAGEELEEDDEELEPGDYFGDDEGSSGQGADGDEAEDSDPSEGRALLTPATPGRGKRKRKERGTTGNSSAFGAVLLLLKSFVGTGVLFLPKAYLNGGMLFSNVVLLIVAAVTYLCFILLVQTHEKIGGSFGDMGGQLYGKYMRVVILASVALSQIGFVAAYIVFTAENLQAFIAAVSNCRTWIDIKFLILLELVVFLPLSLIRDISKLGFTALISDAFILLGLIYLGYYDVKTIVDNHGIADIVNFNPRDWTLYIGTAIFTFEGIGLVIPIKEAMKRPSDFPVVLFIVMLMITVVFTAMGALSYAAFGSSTKTVVLLNLPQDDKFVNTVQLLYSLAILLSTPLQLFPAIRIAENGIFTRSGKHHPYIKWKKNLFRFFLVIVCAAIAWGGAADLDKFVALIGSFACVPLVMIYPVSPALLFFSAGITDVFLKPILHLKAIAHSRFQQVIDVLLCILGAVAMVYTTTLTLKSWASGGGRKEPGYCDR